MNAAGLLLVATLGLSNPVPMDSVSGNTVVEESAETTDIVDNTLLEAEGIALVVGVGMVFGGLCSVIFTNHIGGKK